MELIARDDLDAARKLARRYWDTFERNPAGGSVRAGAGPLVIVDAEGLAITLPQVLHDLLGAAGAELSIYGFGKSYGMAAADHFRSWALSEGASEASSGTGALFWPMHIGLTPRITILEARDQPHLLLLVDIAQGALGEIRAAKGLDTRPTRMLLSGLVSGALTKTFGTPVDARELPGSDGSYRIVVAPPGDLAADLEDPRLTAPEKSFERALVIEA
jgi:hypothetical protein